MDSDEGWFLRIDVAHDEGEVDRAVDHVAVSDHPELAEGGRQPALTDPVDRLLVQHPVLDEVRDGADLDLMVAREHVEVRPPRHAAVLVHDLHDDGGRLEPREPCEVAGRLGVPGPGEHSSRLGAEGEDVAGLDEVLGPRVPAYRPLDGERPVVCRYAGADTFGRVDRHGKHRPVRLGVVFDHRRHADLVAPFGGHRKTDEAPRVAGHEVDVVRLDVLRGDDEVPLVLPALVVDEDHHPAVPELLDERLCRMEARQLAHGVRAPFSRRST